jgi:hypothetical protein
LGSASMVTSLSDSSPRPFSPSVQTLLALDERGRIR